MNVYCFRSFSDAKLRFDLLKKVTTFFQVFFCYAPSQIARKRTKIFQGFQGFQGSGTDLFCAVPVYVMVMMRIATPALHELQTNVWKP